MKTFTLLLSLVILASCSATYKTGQTPDDLYYSKAKPVKYEEKVRYDRTVSTYQESNIRMCITNPRWRNLDYNNDYDYRYNPYTYGYNYGYYYNPYYCQYPVYTTGTISTNPKNTTIRKANLGGYSNTVTNYKPTKLNPGNTFTTRRVYNNTNSNTDNNTRYNTNSTNTDNRTYAPASTNTNSGNSGGSTNGGGTTVTRPGRGG